MKQETTQSQHDRQTDSNPSHPGKRPYEKPSITSEALFESVALGAAKTADDFPLCDEFVGS